MFKSHVLRALSVALLAAVVVPQPGFAETRHRPHHDYDRPDESVVVVGGLPTRIRHLGTFSGAISAVHFRGIGNYFYVSGQPFKPETPYVRPVAKIISVGGDGHEDPCSMESGVCVIRMSPN